MSSLKSHTQRHPCTSNISSQQCMWLNKQTEGVVVGYVWPRLTGKWNVVAAAWGAFRSITQYNNVPCKTSLHKVLASQISTHEINVYSTKFLQPTSGRMTLFYTSLPALPLWLRYYNVKGCFGANPLRRVLMRSFTKDPALWECTCTPVNSFWWRLFLQKGISVVRSAPFWLSISYCQTSLLQLHEHKKTMNVTH